MANAVKTLLNEHDVEPRRSERTQIWAIASGKGGVGRSFLVANLGCIFARDVGPVTLVDLDFEGANLHTLLGQSIGPAGVEAFLASKGVRLEETAREIGIPGIQLVQGPENSVASPNGRARARLLTAIRRLAPPLVVLDLASGGSRAVLDFFAAADKPILVVLPEPAAVENAHQFVRQLFLRRVEICVRTAGIDRETYRKEVGPLLSKRPDELLSGIEKIHPTLGETVGQYWKDRPLFLVVNQVRHISDVAIGFSIKNAVQSFFGISVQYAGSILYDREAWLSARRRRLHTRNVAGDELGAQLEQLIHNILGNVEIELPNETLPFVGDA